MARFVVSYYFDTVKGEPAYGVWSVIRHAVVDCPDVGELRRLVELNASASGSTAVIVKIKRVKRKTVDYDVATTSVSDSNRGQEGHQPSPRRLG